MILLPVKSGTGAQNHSAFQLLTKQNPAKRMLITQNFVNC